MTRCNAIRLSAMALAAAACAGVQAESSPYYIGISQTYSRDSNLLRLPDNGTAPLGYDKADTIASTALLAGMDQSFGRQRAYGSLNVRDNRYSANKLYNNLSYNGNVGLDWSTLNRISGSLTASASRSLQRFSDGEISLVTEKNLERIQNVGATASIGMVTQYTLELTAGHREVKNSLQKQDVQAREFSQDNASIGVRWRPSSANWFGMSVGTTQGRYPKFRTLGTGEYEADRFKRNDIALSAHYEPSGASTLDLRLSRSNTTYDLNQQRDFSGVTGSLMWAWQVTGKIRTFATMARDTGQDSYSVLIGPSQTTSDYGRINRTVRLQADYQFSAKVSFTSSLSDYRRDLVRTIPNFNVLDLEGKDRTRTLSIGGRWSPLRNVTVGCDVSNEKRTASGDLSYAYDARNVGCYGQFTLQ